MAVTGTFIANFDQFTPGVQAATAKLATFEAASMKADVALKSMGTTATSTGIPTDRLRTSLQSFDGVLATLGVNISTQQRALLDLANASGKTASEIGALGTAGLIAGSALAGWKLGRMIAEFFDLDKAISGVTARLLGFGDLAAQTAGAQADVLANASRIAGRAITDLAEALKIVDENYKKTKESQKAYATALGEIMLKGDDWSKTLQTIDAGVVSAAKAMLELGVNQKAIATYWHLTDVQIQAVTKSREADIETTKRQKEIQADLLKATLEGETLAAKMASERFEQELKGIGQIESAEKALSDHVAKLTLSTTDYEILKINERAEAEIEAFKGLQSQRAEYTAKVIALATEQTEALKSKAREAAAAEQQAALDTFNAWVSALAPIGHGPETPNSWSTLNPTPITVNPIGALSGGGSFMAGQGGATDPRVLTLMGNGLTLSEALAIVGGYGTGVNPFPRRAMGGAVSAGKPYWVGDGGGPEVFVPSTNGSIVPNVGGTQVINLVVDGRVLASIVNDHNTKQMKRGRQFPAS